MQQSFGKYRILDTVGAGGQGTVYRAEDPDLLLIVALKVMNQSATDDP